MQPRASFHDLLAEVRNESVERVIGIMSSDNDNILIELMIGELRYRDAFNSVKTLITTNCEDV